MAYANIEKTEDGKYFIVPSALGLSSILLDQQEVRGIAQALDMAYSQGVNDAKADIRMVLGAAADEYHSI